MIDQLPDDKTVYIQRGKVYQEMGNHQYAIKDFEDAIQLDPQSSEAYFYKGTSQLKSKNVRDAIEDFKAAE